MGGKFGAGIRKVILTYKNSLHIINHPLSGRLSGKIFQRVWDIKGEFRGVGIRVEKMPSRDFSSTAKTQ